ncbi:MAG TPA: hypothetical protein ENJ35_01525 [Gammaproteobacteria bacterium]|nr:hypothetical protein [Gammaproteobacteria bacterium]
MIEEPLLGGSLGIDFSLAGLAELRSYYETMERVLNETGKWQLSAIEKRAKGLPAEKQKYYLELYHPHRWLNSFPSQLRASIIVSAMSFLESQLWQITLSAQYYSQKPFKRPKEKILSSYKKYLQEEGQLSLKNNSVWSLINKIYLLRNILVHNGMYLGHENDSDEIKSIKNKIVGLSVDEEGYYIIEKLLCIKLFDCIEEFLCDIRAEVQRVWETENE